jgi:hypothetical protein
MNRVAVTCYNNNMNTGYEPYNTAQGLNYMILGKVEDLTKTSVINQVIDSFKVPEYIPATSKGHI